MLLNNSGFFIQLGSFCSFNELPHWKSKCYSNGHTQRRSEKLVIERGKTIQTISSGRHLDGRMKSDLVINICVKNEKTGCFLNPANHSLKWM